MAQYYINATGGNPFVVGAMAGYDLIDRIYARKQEAEDRKRALALEDERMGMARKDQSMQEERFGIEKQDHERALANERLDTAGKQLNDAYAYWGGAEKMPASEAPRVAKLVRDSDPERFANSTDEELLAIAPQLAMRGGDALETMAIKQRDLAEKDAAFTDVLTLQDVAGLGQQQAPRSAPLGSQQRTGAVSRGTPIKTIQYAPEEAAALDQVAAGDAQKRRFLDTVLAIENRGSAANMRAGLVSPAGAVGPFQFIPETAQAFGLDPQARTQFAPSAKAAGAYYDELNQRYGGNFEAMLADYNGGPTAGAAVMDGRAPPAAETQEYLALARGLQPQPGPEPGVAQLASTNPMAAVAQATPAAPSTAPAAAAPKAAPPSLLGVQANPAGGVDSQAVNRAVVGAAKSVGSSVKTGTERALLRAALDPENPLGNEFRRDPAAQYDRHIAGRSTLLPAERAQLDTLVYQGLQVKAERLQAEIEAAKAGGRPREVQALGAQAERIRTQVRDLNKARSDDLIDQAVPRPAKAGDAPAAALGAAVAQNAGSTPASNAAEVRGLGTQMDRFASNPPPRFTADQVKRVARAVTLGVITPEQGMNLVKTGRMDKPAKPTVLNAGEGMLAVVTENGIQLIDTAAAAGGGKGARLKDSEVRLRHGEAYKLAGNSLTQMHKDGAFDKPGFGDPDLASVVSGFDETMSRARADIETALGVSLTDPSTGSTTYANLDPGAMAVLTQAYRNYRANETDAVFKSSKGFGAYLQEQVGARAAQPAASNDGWVVRAKQK